MSGTIDEDFSNACEKAQNVADRIYTLKTWHIRKLKK